MTPKAAKATPNPAGIVNCQPDAICDSVTWYGVHCSATTEITAESTKPATMIVQPFSTGP